MKKLLLVLAVAAVAAPVASAGGWATVGLSSLPPTGLEGRPAVAASTSPCSSTVARRSPA